MKFCDFVHCFMMTCRLLKYLEGAGDWRAHAVKFVNSISSLMQKLLDYR